MQEAFRYMHISQRSLSAAPRRHTPPSPGTARNAFTPAVLLRALLLLALLPLSTLAGAQTLARPGWAGSGMTAERWWPHAVLCEVTPDSLALDGAAGEGSTFHRIQSRLEDLQTLGVDGVLLRGIEKAPQAEPSGSTSARSGAVTLDERYGTLEAFDDLVSNAVRHGVRVLVELPPGSRGTSLTDDARFWLNRGVTGLSLADDDPASIRAVRAVLRGYVGERVLIAQNSGPSTSQAPRSSPAATNRPDQPDLVRVPLPSIAQISPNLTETIRSGVEAAQGMRRARGPVPLLSTEQGSADDGTARVIAAILLGSGGAALLRADDLDLAHANSTSAQSSVFAWYRQWSGLHRGSPVMRSGDEVLLNHDADGALIWVRQASGLAPVVAICNLAGKPMRLSLVDDIRALKLRGSFLRTVARSDGGMGAMPLREVVLPPHGVYVGELSR